MYKLFGPFSSTFSNSTSMLKKKAIKRPPIIETDRIRLAMEEAQKIIGNNSDIIQQFVKGTKEMREELRTKNLKFKQLKTRQ